MSDQPAAPKRRKSEKRFRNKHVNVALSDEEFNEVQEEANRLGLSRSAYGRGSMLKRNPGPNFLRRPSIQKQQLIRLLALLGHVNHRIDQFYCDVKQGTVPDLCPILQDYAETRREILEFLRRCRELNLALQP